MSRTVWFAAGLASGVYGVFKVKRVLENFTPDGVGARVAAARAGVRAFAGEVASASREREADLLAELRAKTADDRLLEAAAQPAAVPAPRHAAETQQLTEPHPRESVTDGHR